MVACFFQPGVEAAIFLFESADAESFEVPTVFAVVLSGEFGPQSRNFFGIVVHVERKSTFAANLGSGIFHKLGDERDRVSILHAAITQGKKTDVRIVVLYGQLECSLFVPFDAGQKMESSSPHIFILGFPKVLQVGFGFGLHFVQRRPGEITRRAVW